MNSTLRLALALGLIMGFYACKKDGLSKEPKFELPLELMTDLGDTIKLKGMNLPKNLSVSINQFTAELLANDGNSVTFVIPEQLSKIRSTLYFRYNGRVDSLKDFIHLNAPVITGFSDAGFGDTLTIFGDHFDKGPYYTAVKFNETEVYPIKISKKQVKLIVPTNLNAPETVVKITSQHQTVESQLKFILPAPEITSVPEAGYTNTAVLITGRNFSPLAANNHIYLNGVEVPVVASSLTQLSFVLPNGVYPERKVNISYKLFNYEIAVPKPLAIKNTWVKVAQNLPFINERAAVTVNGHAYVVASSYYKQNQNIDYNFYLWKFDQLTFNWEKISLPFTVSGNVYLTSSGSKLFMYESGAGNILREYDPAVNQWETKAKFPGISRFYPTLFCIGSKVYLGLGAYYKENDLTAANDFFALETKTNQWSAIADYPMIEGQTDPYPRFGASAFVIDNVAYVACGASNTMMSNCYKYEATQNQWTRIADFPGPRRFTTSVAVNGKGYIFNGVPFINVNASQGNAFSYDPKGNKWTELANYATGREIVDGLAFELNGKLYVSGVLEGVEEWPLYQAIGTPF